MMPGSMMMFFPPVPEEQRVRGCEVECDAVVCLTDRGRRHRDQGPTEGQNWVPLADTKAHIETLEEDVHPCLVAGLGSMVV